MSPLVHSVLVSCILCGRLHEPTDALDTNPVCGDCTAPKRKGARSLDP